MLRIFSSAKHLRVGELMSLYLADRNGFITVRDQQRFYTDILDFFQDDQCCCAVWLQENAYAAALRFEPYLDGFLISGLITAPKLRGKGFARKLLQESMDYLRSIGCKAVYSHIHSDNATSIYVHSLCNFQLLQHFAVFLDGTVDANSLTYVCNL